MFSRVSIIEIFFSYRFCNILPYLEFLIAKLVSSLSFFVVIFYRNDWRIYANISKNKTITKYSYVKNFEKSKNQRKGWKKVKFNTYETNLKKYIGFIKSSLQLELHALNWDQLKKELDHSVLLLEFYPWRYLKCMY